MDGLKKLGFRIYNTCKKIKKAKKKYSGRLLVLLNICVKENLIFKSYVQKTIRVVNGVKLKRL